MTFAQSIRPKLTEEYFSLWWTCWLTAAEGWRVLWHLPCACVRLKVVRSSSMCRSSAQLRFMALITGQSWAAANSGGWDFMTVIPWLITAVGLSKMGHSLAHHTAWATDRAALPPCMVSQMRVLLIFQTEELHVILLFNLPITRLFIKKCIKQRAAKSLIVYFWYRDFKPSNLNK